MRAYERDDFKKHYSLGDKYWYVVCNICTPNYCDIGLLNRNNKGKLRKKKTKKSANAKNEKKNCS